MATSLPIAKSLIKYNSYNLEENEEDEEQIDIELNEQKADPEMMKMLLTFDYRVYKKTRKILLLLISLRACRSKLMRSFSKKVTE